MKGVEFQISNFKLQNANWAEDQPLTTNRTHSICNWKFSFCNLQSLLFTAVLCALFAAPTMAQRGLKNIPDPDPELERKTFKLADGFEVNLYAGDPLQPSELLAVLVVIERRVSLRFDCHPHGSSDFAYL